MLNRRVVLHAIDTTPARWRGDACSSPLDRARTAASSPRNDLVKNCRVRPTHWLISTQVVARVRVGAGVEEPCVVAEARDGLVQELRAPAQVPVQPVERRAGEPAPGHHPRAARVVLPAPRVGRRHGRVRRARCDRRHLAREPVGPVRVVVVPRRDDVAAERVPQLRRRALPLRADARAPRQVHVARARERRARAGLDRPPRRVAGRVVDDEHLGARRGVRLRRDVRQAALEVAGPVEGDDGDADPRSRWYPDRLGRWRDGA